MIKPHNVEIQTSKTTQKFKKDLFLRVAPSQKRDNNINNIQKKHYLFLRRAI